MAYWLRTYLSISCSIFRAWKEDSDTQDTAMAPRCRRSWWSTSAIEALNLARSPPTMCRTTCRLSLSDVAPGTRKSYRAMPTNMGYPPDRGRAWKRPGLVPDHLADLEVLDHIAFLDVVEVLESDTALEAGRNLPGVVLEAPQRGDPAGVDHGAVPHEARPGAPDDLSLGDVASGHGRPRDLERGPYLRRAEQHLLLLGGQQALQGGADVVEELVDDLVGPDVHTLPLAELAGAGVRTHAEADHDGVGGLGQRDVALADRPHAPAQHVDAQVRPRHLRQRPRQRLQRALRVGLQDQAELGDVAGAGLEEQVLQRRGLAAGDQVRLALT